jgi:hypothetical protein
MIIERGRGIRRKKGRKNNNNNNNKTLAMKRIWQKILEPHRACDVFKTR